MSITPAVPKVAKRVSTRRRILASARRLFNQGGVRGTAVLRIAYDLEMSPGNLTYHFKNKADLVRELAQTLTSEIDAAITNLRPPLEPEDVIVHLEMVLTALWSYRFLFNSAIEVSRMDAEISSQIAALEDRIRATLIRYVDEAIARGEMRRPAQEDGVVLLCDNVVALWLQWLQAESMRQPGRDDLGLDALRHCMRRYYSLIDPYVSRDFAEKSWAGIARRYGPAECPPRA